MCGIVGYIGNRQAYPILIKGLHRLEYRGYDSAGIALINHKNLKVYKAKGKVSELEHFAEQKDISGTIGIAHTRWATHGEPNQKNAHPHYSQSEEIAIIHNGIIENYAVLKQRAALGMAYGGMKPKRATLDSVTAFDAITKDKPTLAGFLRSLPCIEAPWDAAFQKRYCSSCTAENCDACANEQFRNNPEWWLSLPAAEVEQ